MTARRAVVVVCAAGALSGWGTSSSGYPGLPEDSVLLESDSTSAGVGMLFEEAAAGPVGEREDPRSGLAHLRRISGLTWEQVARMFGVSRRSVHFWASGKAMSAEHEEHLYQLLAVLRGTNAAADAVRARLLSVVAGEQILTMLAERRYTHAAEALGGGEAAAAVPREPLSASARDARRPLPPDFLAASEEDHGHQPEGRGRAVRTVRRKSSERS